MNAKKLNAIARYIYSVSMILGLVFSIISVTNKVMFTTGFVIFVVNLFFLLNAIDAREKMEWK